MSSSIAIVALSSASGLVMGWFLCHLAHTSARSDANHFRRENDVLRSKAIRIDEQRLSARAEAQLLHEQLQELRESAKISVVLDGDEEIDLDLDEVARRDLEPPVRPERSGEHGRLAEAFGTD